MFPAASPTRPSTRNNIAPVNHVHCQNERSVDPRKIMNPRAAQLRPMTRYNAAPARMPFRCRNKSAFRSKPLRASGGGTPGGAAERSGIVSARTHPGIPAFHTRSVGDTVPATSCFFIATRVTGPSCGRPGRATYQTASGSLSPPGNVGGWEGAGSGSNSSPSSCAVSIPAAFGGLGAGGFRLRVHSERPAVISGWRRNTSPSFAPTSARHWSSRSCFPDAL